MRLRSLITLIALSGCATTSADMATHPQSGSAVRREMASALESGDRAAVTRGAALLASMGSGLSDGTLNRIEPLFDPALISGTPADLRQQLVRNRQPGSPAGKAVLEVPEPYRLVEGMAWTRGNLALDAPSLFVGTVVDGLLLEYGYGPVPDHAVPEEVRGALHAYGYSWRSIDLGYPRGGLFGMAADESRDLLWIATGSVDQYMARGERMTGLIAVDLKTKRVARRVPVAGTPEGAANDLTIADDGTVYVSNSMTGAIHRCRPGCTVLEDLIPPGQLKSPQGLALSDNGKLLYAADYAAGLWVIDLKTATAAPIKVPSPMMLDGIDGLIRTAPNELLAVQNGTNPRRIIRIRLDKGGRAVTRLDVVEQQLPEWGEPTLIALSPPSVFRVVPVNALGGPPAPPVPPRDWPPSITYIADGQWEVWGKDGKTNEGQKPRATVIRSLSLPNNK